MRLRFSMAAQSYLRKEENRPLKILLILAHPSPSSLNAAIAKRSIDTLVGNGHTVVFHDLYRERFEPVLPLDEFSREAELSPELQAHCEEISEVDGIIIVHPNWWGQPPAILKGWIDRVIRPGVAYEFIEGDSGEGVPKGLLRAKSAIVFNTSNTDSTREIEVFQDPLETIWRNCIFGLCGISDVFRRVFTVVVTSDRKQRERWLSEVGKIVDSHYPNGD